MLRLQMRCRAQPTALRPVLECAMLCRAPTSSSSPQNLARAAFSASLHRAARPLPQRKQQQLQTYDTRRAVLVGEGGSRPRRESSRSGTLIDSQRRPASTTAAADAAAGSNSSSSSSGSSSSRLPDLDKVLSLVTQARDRLLAHPGIPTEGEIKATLSVCAEAADLIMDAAVQPRLSSIDHQADTVASTLLSLDGRSLSGSSPASASAPTTASTASSPSSSPSSSSSPSMAASSEHQPRLRYVIGEISDAAYAVVEDPRVSITPRLLEQYIHIQARLARPESLPRVLQLYASKPQPRPGGRSSSSSSSDTSIRYVPQNASKPTKAVDAAVADAALETALAAKNLDAAVGVVEHTFAAPAYMRYKMLRKGLLPALALVGLPPATYLLAARLANWQQSMEVATATNMAFASILAYICCTGTIGLVATMTANDQMRRVTWAPGTPLRERWLREEERAALDRVACAFGFSEPYRYGEEEGAEFHALREYIARKGMLVDQIELQGGMS